MSRETEQISQEEAMQRLSIVTENDLPQAEWAVGGAFRYDRSLMVVAQFLASSLGVRTISRVAGTPPCLWNLDHFVQRRPIPLNLYCENLERYAQMGIGVTLVFDNPFLTAEEIEDSYGALLVRTLYERDRTRQNAVSVASDALAAKIRSLCPHLKLEYHYNRLIAEQSKRTASLYNRLAERCDRVTLHPADAAKSSITKAIEHPERFDVVINDPTPRTHPARRELLQLLADMRRHPYDTDLMRRRADLTGRIGDTRADHNTLHQKATCNLTRREAQALYDMGFRRFIIQSSLFRNEMTLLWDIFRCMLSHSPELINKHALIASSAMAEFGKPSSTMPSGLKQFGFSQSE